MEKQSNINYDRIKKDCFWDLNISNTDINNAVNGKDFRTKAFLFEKLLLNSTKLFIDLNIFKHEELESLVDNFKVPKFNYDYTFRRKNLVEVYFFDRPLLIDELKWVS